MSVLTQILIFGGGGAYFLNLAYFHVLPWSSVLLVPFLCTFTITRISSWREYRLFLKNYRDIISFPLRLYLLIHTTFCVRTFSESFIYSCPYIRLCVTCTCVVRNSPWNTRIMKMAGATLQGPVVTVGTVKFKIKCYALCPHSIFLHVFCVIFYSNGNCF